MAKQKALTYQEAMTQLEAIVHNIEHEPLDVDDLSEKVKTALSLVDYCKTKLRTTEDTIRQAFETEDED